MPVPRQAPRKSRWLAESNICARHGQWEWGELEIEEVQKGHKSAPGKGNGVSE